MNKNSIGELVFSESELIDLLMCEPRLNLNHTTVSTQILNPNSAEILPSDFYFYEEEKECKSTVDFDKKMQSQWFMPKFYKTLDIEKHLFSLCKTEIEISRVKEELELYREKNLISLLQYMYYLVNTLKENNIIWGVGRGSSTASYVLFLLGVHRVNSLEYEIPLSEFLK